MMLRVYTDCSSGIRLVLRYWLPSASHGRSQTRCTCADLAHPDRYCSSSAGCPAKPVLLPAQQYGLLSSCPVQSLLPMLVVSFLRFHADDLQTAKLLNPASSSTTRSLDGICTASRQLRPRLHQFRNPRSLHRCRRILRTVDPNPTLRLPMMTNLLLVSVGMATQSPNNRISNLNRTNPSKVSTTSSA